MRVLVTGSSGFIGKNLVEQLGKRHEVLAPPHRELDLLDGDGVRTWLRAHRPDAIVHAATTPGHRNAPPVPDLGFRNVKMFMHLAESRDCFGRLIVLGSGAEYDQRRSAPKLREDQAGEQVPKDDTGLSKLTVSRLVVQHRGWVHLRPFGVFGKYEDWEIRFISNALCKALFGLPITLRQDRRFDYLFVDDLVEIVAAFLQETAPGGVYNATPDEAIELSRVAQLVREVSGKEVPIEIAAQGMGPEYSGSNEKLRAALPEVRFTPIRTAVAGLWDYYVQHRARLSVEALRADK